VRKRYSRRGSGDNRGLNTTKEVPAILQVSRGFTFHRNGWLVAKKNKMSGVPSERLIFLYAIISTNEMFLRNKEADHRFKEVSQKK
jgi:hypothetical protein